MVIRCHKFISQSYPHKFSGPIPASCFGFVFAVFASEMLCFRIKKPRYVSKSSRTVNVGSGHIHIPKIYKCGLRLRHAKWQDVQPQASATVLPSLTAWVYFSFSSWLSLWLPGFQTLQFCHDLSATQPSNTQQSWRHLETAAWGLGCTLCGFAWCRFLRHVMGRTEGRTCREGKCRNASKFYIGSNFTRRRRWQLRGWSHSLLHVCVRQKKFHPILTSCCNPRLHKLHFSPIKKCWRAGYWRYLSPQIQQTGKGFKSGPPHCLAALWPQSYGASPWHDFPIQDISGFVKMFSSPV